jgi:outer membrane lipoprotein-sorting protein
MQQERPKLKPKRTESCFIRINDMNWKPSLIFSILIFVSVSIHGDTFDTIKKQLKDANCTSIEFLSIVSSRVFESTDSAKGRAEISKDGRYNVVVGSDVYINDGKKLYSYSPASNQIIVQNRDSGSTSSSDISFITRLDDWYSTTVIKPDMEYQLTKLSKTGTGNIPDSMKLIIDRKTRKILRLEYLDINDEPVTIIILNEKHDAKCNDSHFLPDFPDSAERIKL